MWMIQKLHSLSFFQNPLWPMVFFIQFCLLGNNGCYNYKVALKNLSVSSGKNFTQKKLYPKANQPKSQLSMLILPKLSYLNQNAFNVIE